MVVKTGTSAEDEQATWVRFRVAMNRIGWEMVRGRQRVSDLWWMITGSHHCLLPYDCNSILTFWLSSFCFLSLLGEPSSPYVKDYFLMPSAALTLICRF